MILIGHFCTPIFQEQGAPREPEPAMEQFTPMEVTVTAEAPTRAPAPPRITQHLKNAEVMEGTK